VCGRRGRKSFVLALGRRVPSLLPRLSPVSHGMGFTYRGTKLLFPMLTERPVVARLAQLAYCSNNPQSPGIAMSDVSGRLKDAAAGAKYQADETVEGMRWGAKKTIDDAADVVQAKTAEAMEAGMDAVDQTASVGEALKASIQRQPLTAMAVAAAAGFLFGRMFIRRR
jgi:ElaB/YqjD/DUF883 family membrane-anchored ribosome-binding protein